MNWDASSMQALCKLCANSPRDKIWFHRGPAGTSGDQRHRDQTRTSTNSRKHHQGPALAAHRDQLTGLEECPDLPCLRSSVGGGSAEEIVPTRSSGATSHTHLVVPWGPLREVGFPFHSQCTIYGFMCVLSKL